MTSLLCLMFFMQSSKLMLISEEETTEPTGTKISVPIHPGEEGLSKTLEMFEYESFKATCLWNPQPNYVGFNTYTKDLTPTVISKGTDWMIVKDSSSVLEGRSENLIALVDGISYIINSSKVKSENREGLNSLIDSNYYDDYRAIVKIKTGKISLSASREEIEYLPENLELIKEKNKVCKKELIEKGVNLVNKGKTVLDKSFILRSIYNGNAYANFSQRNRV